MIKLRHENEDLQSDGGFEVVFAKENTYPFIFKRGSFIIAVNPTEKAQDAPFEFEGECVFSIGEAKIGNKKISMLPQSLTVIKI